MSVAPRRAIAATNAIPAQPGGKPLTAFLPGLGMCVLIALVSIALGTTRWVAESGLSPLVVALIGGAVTGNLFPREVDGRLNAGIALSKQKLLRLGIILYGVRLTFADVATVGMHGIAVDALVLGSTFLLALFLGIRVLKMDRGTVVLIGAGSAICGAAAVLATEPVLKARAEQVTVAVATVVIFGTLATFLYPLLFQWNLTWQLLPVSASGFGLYAGSTIHEVAQVVAAARSIDASAVDTAVIAKMIRVMMLPVFLIALSAALLRLDRRQKTGAGPTGSGATLAVPWFALGFLAVVMLNSIVTLPPGLAEHLLDLDTLLLTVAMAALGLTTHVSAFRTAGVRPVILASALFLWLVAGGAWINALAM